MSAKFNTPIERLGHASGITGWGWFFIILIIIIAGLAAWFGYTAWQQKIAELDHKAKTGLQQSQANLVYINSIEEQDGRYYATIDPVEWLTGSQAEQQAKADGACQASSTDCLSNGFYLRNSTTSTAMVLLNPQATILMQTLTATASGTPQWDQVINFDTWKELFQSEQSHWHKIPFRLLIKDDEVMSIREQYLP